eukprot:CAMPEP_0182917798 /NCGR_PEP_ID=MMETSP0105_2-20130417/1713_1 /TAXON_ID=81532 ORGANISM="Acanthoeca-like sp., Strain 10tr" /NCGR_SAMPLE_ID=MMETSP0105_2 /ASSEMBLY_ACC=CAM_ASM_000205 /LENGTH=418 /DNA_ID=CAMNT_0025054817 /DNA_START=83 /DNA_END=1339 /DNA_ORIENTATION=-
MADGGDYEKAKLGPQLPTEIASGLKDEDFYRLYKEGAIQRREGGMALSEDNWEEELDAMPLFMKKTPTQEDIDKNPQLQALQAMIHEDSTPESRAESHKDHGNSLLAEAKKMKGVSKKVKTAEFKKVLQAYDAALAEECKDAKLTSVIHSNKAAVNLLLGNRRTAINDCKAAIELNPENVKAYWRGCTANVQLEHYDAAIEFADGGLRIDPTNKTLAAERQKAVKEKGAINKKARQKAAQVRKKEKKDAELLAAFKSRRLKFQKPVEIELDVSMKGVRAAGGEVFIDDQRQLHWPMILLYPEHQQTDFIQDCAETHAFEDHLAIMFNPKDSIPWDAENKYKAGALSVYFETQPERDYMKTKLVRVQPDVMLGEAIQDARYTLVDLTPAFFVLATGSPFEKKFLEQHNYDGAVLAPPKV